MSTSKREFFTKMTETLSKRFKEGLKNYDLTYDEIIDNANILYNVCYQIINKN